MICTQRPLASCVILTGAFGSTDTSAFGWHSGSEAFQHAPFLMGAPPTVFSSAGRDYEVKAGRLLLAGVS